MFIFLVLATRALLFDSGPSAMAQQQIGLPTRGICAHRGASATHPENTLLALQEAIRLGAQMLEFDVRQTRDGQLVLMHDETVDRTTDGTGQIAQLAYADLRDLDLSNWSLGFRLDLDED